MEEQPRSRAAQQHRMMESNGGRVRGSGNSAGRKGRRGARAGGGGSTAVTSQEGAATFPDRGRGRGRGGGPRQQQQRMVPKGSEERRSNDISRSSRQPPPRAASASASGAGGEGRAALPIGGGSSSKKGREGWEIATFTSTAAYSSEDDSSQDSELYEEEASAATGSSPSSSFEEEHPWPYQCAYHHYHSSAPAHPEAEEEVATGGEQGAATRRPPSKRRFILSGNYLLNFTYKRDQPPPASFPSRRRGPPVHFNKERYLQANYRFVVNPSKPYLQHLYEPDLLVEWEDIEQIYLSSPLPYKCPICLDEPLAPKMTRCGHIFCWGCILHYLSLGVKSWRKCPICFDLISSKHLKSTVIELAPLPEPGDLITFTLMKREKSCMVALPLASWQPVHTFLHHDEPDAVFSRFTLASSHENGKEDLDFILDREQAELSEAAAQAAAGHDEASLPFLDMAMEVVRERRAKYREATQQASSLLAASATLQGQQVTAPVPQEGEKESKTCKSRSENGGAGSGDAADVFYYYFYQCKDGRFIFLHPLNMRCFLHEYGSPESFPTTIRGRVLQLDETTQTELTRKRQKKVVGHLPLSTPFLYCEIEMHGKSDEHEAVPGSNFYISPSTLDHFAPDFMKREEQRRQKAYQQDTEEHVEPEFYYNYEDWGPAAPSESQPSSFVFRAEDMPQLGQLSIDEGGERGTSDDDNKAKGKEKQGNHKNGSGNTVASSPSFLQVASNKAPPPLHTIIRTHQPNSNGNRNGKTTEMSKKQKQKAKQRAKKIQLFSTTSGRRY
ncbi:RING finger protein 10 [Balamuthia mandrillaris]